MSTAELADDGKRVAGEIASLRGRTSNIPDRDLRIRELICDGVGADAASIPFVGELIGVRDDETRWEGAAERVLRGFGLSLLVSQDDYDRVSAWINGHHLGGRVVYYKVPPKASLHGVSTPRRAPSPTNSTSRRDRSRLARTQAVRTRPSHLHRDARTVPDRGIRGHHHRADPFGRWQA